MNDLIKIRTLSLVFLFCLLSSCSKQNTKRDLKSKILTGRIVIEETNQTINNADINLYIQTRPLFSMRGWKKLYSTKTNNHGEFEFEINKSGVFELRWNPENNIWPNSYRIDDFENEKYVEIVHKVGLYPKKSTEKTIKDRHFDIL